MAQGLLAEVEQASATKCRGAAVIEHEVIGLAAMEGEADGLLVAEGDGLSGWLIGCDGDEGNPPWGRLSGLGGEEGKVDLLDDIEDGFNEYAKL